MRNNQGRDKCLWGLQGCAQLGTSFIGNGESVKAVDQKRRQYEAYGDLFGNE